MIRFAVVCLFLSVGTLAWAADGYLKTKVNPGRAGVFVNGKYLGPAANFGKARKYKLPEGEHELKLAEPRYQEVTKKFTITAGKTTTVSEKLTALPLAQPPFARLRVMGPDKFSAIFLNNKFYGHLDEFSNFAQGLLIPAGQYTVRVEPTSGAPYEEKVTLTANQITIVRAK